VVAQRLGCAADAHAAVYLAAVLEDLVFELAMLSSERAKATHRVFLTTGHLRAAVAGHAELRLLFQDVDLPVLAVGAEKPWRNGSPTGVDLWGGYSSDDDVAVDEWQAQCDLDRAEEWIQAENEEANAAKILRWVARPMNGFQDQMGSDLPYHRHVYLVDFLENMRTESAFSELSEGEGEVSDQEEL